MDLQFPIETVEENGTGAEYYTIVKTNALWRWCMVGYEWNSTNPNMLIRTTV